MELGNIFNKKADIYEEESAGSAEFGEFKLEEVVSWRGEQGWQIIDTSSANSPYVEIAKFKANKLGEMVYAREIVEKHEVEKIIIEEA